MAGTFDQRVLVLNRNWQAVNIVGIKRAFSLLFTEHARVIEARDGAFELFDCTSWVEYSLADPPDESYDGIRTVRVRLRLPRILLLHDYDRLPVKEVKFTRDTVFERDHYTCQYCGRSYGQGDLNLDHVIPRDRGGRTSWENIVTSCVRCNTRKSNRLPHEAGMRLQRKPQRPKWRPFVSFMLEGDIHESWTHFLHGKSSSD